MKLPSGYYRKGGMTVESTKERILETALTLFARNGYLGTSMSDIAGALGITKAALYKHYRRQAGDSGPDRRADA